MRCNIKLQIAVYKLVASICLVGMFAGCMSMDEMLASNDPFWRDIGESRAVDFTIDKYGANDLQAKLDVVGKMRDQTKLAKIYVAKSAAPEIRKAARAKITEESAFVHMLSVSADAMIRKEALEYIKSDAYRVLAASTLYDSKDKESASDLLRQVEDRSYVTALLLLLTEDGMKRWKSAGSHISSKTGDMLNAIEDKCRFLSAYAIADNALMEKAKDFDVLVTKGLSYDFATPLLFATVLGNMSDAEKIRLGRGGVNNGNWRDVDISDAELLELRKRNDIYSQNFKQSFYIDPEIALLSVRDEMSFVEYISGLESEDKIKEATDRYVKKSETRQMIALKRLERFADEGKLVGQNGDARPDEREKLLLNLVEISPANELRRFAEKIGEQIVKSPLLVNDWNHGLIPFTVFLRMAEKCNDIALTRVLMAQVANCIGLIHDECSDKKKQDAEFMHTGHSFSWARSDDIHAAKVMNMWRDFVADDEVIAVSEHMASNCMVGWRYLALGREGDVRSEICRRVKAVCEKELTKLDTQTASHHDLITLISRGMSLEQLLSGKSNLTTTAQIDAEFENKPICIVARVNDVCKVGSSVKADVYWLNCRVDYAERGLKIDETRFDLFADRDDLKNLVLKWSFFDSVCVQGILQSTKDRRCLGRIVMNGVVDLRLYKELSLIIAKRNRLQSLIDEASNSF